MFTYNKERSCSREGCLCKRKTSVSLGGQILVKSTLGRGKWDIRYCARGNCQEWDYQMIVWDFLQLGRRWKEPEDNGNRKGTRWRGNCNWEMQECRGEIDIGKSWNQEHVRRQRFEVVCWVAPAKSNSLKLGLALGHGIRTRSVCACWCWTV